MIPAARTAGRGPGGCAAADANEHRSSFDLLFEDVGAAGSGREWWIPAGERAVADPLRWARRTNGTSTMFTLPSHAL